RADELRADDSELEAAFTRASGDPDPRVKKLAREILDELAARKAPPPQPVAAHEARSIIPTAPTATSRPVDGGRRDERSMIVAVFEVHDEDRQLGARQTRKMTDYLEAQLAAVAGWRVIPRAELLRQIQTKKADSYRACVDEACQIELGKAAAAE